MNNIFPKVALVLLLVFAPTIVGLVLAYCFRQDALMPGIDEQELLQISVLLDIGVPGHGHDVKVLCPLTADFMLNSLTVTEIATRVAFDNIEKWPEEAREFGFELAFQGLDDQTLGRFEKLLLKARSESLDSRSAEEIWEEVEAENSRTKFNEWYFRIHRKYYAALRLIKQHDFRQADKLLADCEVVVEDVFKRARTHQSNAIAPTPVHFAALASFVVDIKMKRAGVARSEGLYDVAERHLERAASYIVSNSTFLPELTTSVNYWALQKQVCWTKLDEVDRNATLFRHSDFSAEELGERFEALSKEIDALLTKSKYSLVLVRDELKLSIPVRRLLERWSFHCRLGKALCLALDPHTLGGVEKAKAIIRELEKRIEDKMGDPVDLGMMPLLANIQERRGDINLFGVFRRNSGMRKAALEALESYDEAIANHLARNDMQSAVFEGLLRKRWLARSFAGLPSQFKNVPFPHTSQEAGFSDSQLNYLKTLDTLIASITSEGGSEELSSKQRALLFERLAKRLFVASQEQRYGRDERRVLRWIMEKYEFNSLLGLK